ARPSRRCSARPDAAASVRSDLPAAAACVDPWMTPKRSTLIARGGRIAAIAALRQNARRHALPTFRCCGWRGREIASLLNILALLARRGGLYVLDDSKVPGGPCAARAHCCWSAVLDCCCHRLEARAMALNHVTLDDKYDLDKTRVF